MKTRRICLKQVDIWNISKQGPNTCYVALIRVVRLISYSSQTWSSTLPPPFLLRLLDSICVSCLYLYSGGVGAVVKISASQSWGPRFEGWPSFPLKFTQLSILPGSVKWVPAYMDRFEAAARGAYICFRSAGGKLIIVKRLWACYMEKALYKCTTLLFYFLYSVNRVEQPCLVLSDYKNNFTN